MITSKDIGKECFLRVEHTEYSVKIERWDRTGATIAGLTKGNILVKLAEGNVVAIIPANVRVFEPRPVTK